MPLSQLVSQVDKTHPGLGKLVAAEAIAIKAKLAFMVIAPTGCGKSIALKALLPHFSPSIQLDTASMAALGAKAHELTGFSGLLYADDVARGKTLYARVSTVTTLADLCYSHSITRLMKGSTFSITDFQGSVVINIQPILFKRVVFDAEWEASARDKCLRFYHPYYPTKPNPQPIELAFPNSLPIDKVATPSAELLREPELRRLAELQWGVGRQIEHSLSLIKAVAALEGHEKPTKHHVRLLADILKPCLLEELLVRKEVWEGAFIFNSPLCYLVMAFFSYGSFTLAELCRHHAFSEATARKLLEALGGQWVIVDKSPTRYGPARELAHDLSKLGYTGERLGG